MLLSLITLAVCFVQFNSFYQFSFLSSGVSEKGNRLKVMNYNVRAFNTGNWIKEDNIQKKIEQFIAAEDPDVLTFQEYRKRHKMDFSKYKYNYVESNQAVYSKYPIISQGSLDFKNTSNNAIFADILKGKDTIRVYNLHLESLHLNPDDIDFNQEASRRLLRRISNSFHKQQLQMEIVERHKKETSHKVIVTGDLNNTAFSYIYRKIKADMNDTFVKSGSGLGKTYVLKNIPLRIDFILADKRFEVSGFKTYTEKYSDHFPISTTLTWE